MGYFGEQCGMAAHGALVKGEDLKGAGRGQTSSTRSKEDRGGSRDRGGLRIRLLPTGDSCPRASGLWEAVSMYHWRGQRGCEGGPREVPCSDT